MTIQTIFFLGFSLLAFFVAVVGFVHYQSKRHEIHLSAALAALILWVIFIGGIWMKWHTSGLNAQILNREFGTSYTQQELFWNSDTIQYIQGIKYKQIEINGDLLKKLEN